MLKTRSDIIDAITSHLKSIEEIDNCGDMHNILKSGKNWLLDTRENINQVNNMKMFDINFINATIKMIGADIEEAKGENAR